MRKPNPTSKCSIGVAVVSGGIAIPSDPTDIIGTPLGGAIACGALLVWACAATDVLEIPEIEIPYCEARYAKCLLSGLNQKYWKDLAGALLDLPFGMSRIWHMGG